MFVQLRKTMLQIDAEDDTDQALPDWLAAHAGQVFKLHGSGRTLRLHAMGPEAEACREPLNITSKAPVPLKLISNFARTPFDLEGEPYASIEGFWQGLKFPDKANRARLAGLFGSDAKDEGFRAPASDTIAYGGAIIRVGTWDHWQLMERACFAKFSQHGEARSALLATGKRPLTHQIGQDSKTIPGVIMAQIWMRIREQVQGIADLAS